MKKQKDRLVELLEESSKRVGEYIDSRHIIPSAEEVHSLRADYLLANGVIVTPCKVGDTVYKIRKFCETNIGYKEEYKSEEEFEADCPYLDRQAWYDDSDRCKAITDYDEA